MKIYQFLSNRNSLSVSIACVVMVCFAPLAQADNIAFAFPLSGDQQVPANPSTATGSCNIILNELSGAVTVSCMFNGLTTAAVAAHIHGLAPAGINAAVIVPLTASAAINGTIVGDGVLDAAQMTGMIDGLTYVNLHTSQNPGGEIRGQITLAPASSPIPTLGNSLKAIMAVLLLLAGAVVLRRRFV